MKKTTLFLTLSLCLIAACKKDIAPINVEDDKSLFDATITKKGFKFKNYNLGVKRLKKLYKTNFELERVCNNPHIHKPNFLKNKVEEMHSIQNNERSGEDDVIVTNAPLGKWKLTVELFGGNIKNLRCRQNETIKDCMERYGLTAIQCDNAGLSDACLMKLVSGNVDATQQSFLNDCQTD